MRISFQSLKFQIAGNLAFIILLSVLLSDFVILNIIQKSLIREYISQGKQFLMLLPDTLYDPSVPSMDEPERLTAPAINDPSIIYLHIRLNDATTYQFGHANPDLQKIIHQLTEQTIADKTSRTEFYDDTFGVFLQQKKYVLITEPITGTERDVSGAKVIVIHLDHVYQALRHSQKVIVLYVIGNFVLLLLFGVYRLSRLIIRPIHRFIKMTDDFRDRDRLYFTHGKNYQEFNQLSKALNHMVDVIETDRENLQHSLQELELANKELKTAQNEIVKAEKLASVGRLSAGIAHEIGNPIGIVLGYLDLLKSRPNLKNDHVGQDFLKRAQDEINRINTVIRQLLDFSRSSVASVRIISIHDIVKDVVSMMSEQPLMANIDIDCHLPDIRDTVSIDGDQIRQVLINLIINAADSIQAAGKKSKGRIRIISDIMEGNDDSPSDRKTTLLLKLIDNGSGISNDHIEYIFDPFFTTKEPGKGTGLGLSVSYMIIEQAGGWITVESEIGQGTTMTIYLPVNQKE